MGAGQRAGLAAAAKKGKRGGRRPKLSPRQKKFAIKMAEDPETTIGDVANHFRVSRATIHRVIKEDRGRREVKELEKAA